MMYATATYSMNVPASDASLLRSLAKRFGWTVKRLRTATSSKKCELDKALDDFERGNVKKFDTVDDMMAYLNA